MRPSPRQVHGLLHAVPRRRCSQGRERGHRHHQDKEVHPVRRLVSHRIQSRNQLPGKKIKSLKDRNATASKKMKKRKNGQYLLAFYRHNLT